ncbi:MAG: hypothetical protein HPY90_05625 [Syntrophothermus sp.]|uniref:hypothetical protein n=1 Tax=Syntrophothermus sp. TaxID=2736299 RepID=UPI00257CE9D2|nr:hypothetical protein [Syntrophothermus sp.]NSW82744.1 hypothetical protein [Syntrophothermus sp.]
MQFLERRDTLELSCGDTIVFSVIEKKEAKKYTGTVEQVTSKFIVVHLGKYRETISFHDIKNKNVVIEKTKRKEN